MAVLAHEVVRQLETKFPISQMFWVITALPV